MPGVLTYSIPLVSSKYLGVSRRIQAEDAQNQKYNHQIISRKTSIWMFKSKNVNRKGRSKIGYSKENWFNIKERILALILFWVRYHFLSKKISCCTKTVLNGERRNLFESFLGNLARYRIIQHSYTRGRWNLNWSRFSYYRIILID